MKILNTLFLLLLSLNARENPFFPTKDDNVPLLTSNEKKDKEPLDKVQTILPNQARILQKVTLEYKNLDGSIETKIVEIDKKIDWHIPISISQNKPQEEPLVYTKQSTKEENKESAKSVSMESAKFSINSKKIKIQTQDKILRDFAMTSPNRVVIDFSNPKEVKNQSFNIGTIVKNIKIGSHKEYYRAVIELDGRYKYKLLKTAEGCEITLY